MTIDLCFMSAGELAGLIRAGKVSAREVMVAHLKQIRRVNPMINAIVAKLDDNECLALADEADQRLSKGEKPGPLHGLPIAFKDLEAAIGFPYSRGSSIFRDSIPAEDTLLVERLRHAGVIPIGKTNVPEFGMGSHTYNNVYGTTRNPYDLTKSAGGSSGGAGAALAARLLPIADGSDLGGSLRNPASFNNVVGLRPTMGLVPTAPVLFPPPGFGVKGPMARSVADVALLLSVMAGPDPRDPDCYASDPSVFTRTLDRTLRGVRVAWTPDLGGLPLDPGVREVLEARRKTFEDLGCIVEEACPDLTGANEIFLTIRAWNSWRMYGSLLETNRAQMKPEAAHEIQSGAAITSADAANAMAGHRRLMGRIQKFQDTYEFVLCTVSQLPPFEATLDWPKEIDRVLMDNYVAWMKSAYWISVTRCPAISVPAGFTAGGLPVGIQIIGRIQDDLGVLQLAHAFEQATNYAQTPPSIAQEPLPESW